MSDIKSTLDPVGPKESEPLVDESMLIVDDENENEPKDGDQDGVEKEKVEFEPVTHAKSVLLFSRPDDRDGTGTGWRNSGEKTRKLSKFVEMIQLNRVFGHIGRWVAIAPFSFIISAVILSSLICGMLKMELRDRVRDGYTPTTSPARRETDILRHFFNSKSDPIMTIVLLLARDGGSMHRPEYLEEALRVHGYIMNNVSMEYKGQRVVFNDFCGTSCQANFFFEFMAKEFIKIGSGEIKHDFFRAWDRLEFPITQIHGIDMHFERNFFGVKTDETLPSDEAVVVSDPLTAIHNMSNVRFIEIIQLLYKGETLNGLDEDGLAKWEMALYKYTREQFKSDLIEMQVIGSEIVDYEMNKESQMMGPFVGFGFCLMIIFSILSNGLNSYYNGCLNRWIPLVSVVATLCSLLAVGATFGLYGLLGMRVNSVMLIMPFLTLGIGVNDSFMLAHAFFRQINIQPNVICLMSTVYAEVGPSITITTLTNVVTFLIGAWMPTAEFQLFCTAAAIALGYCYIFTIVLFGPILVLVYQKPTAAQERLKSAGRELLERMANKFLDVYSRIMCSRIFHLLNFIVFATFMGFAIYGAINITAKLDTEKILPKHSLIRRPHEIVAHKVWFEYYPLQVFVNKPFDLADVRQMRDFKQMLEDFYIMPFNKGKRYTISWFDDYKRYFDSSMNEFDFDFHSETGVGADEGELPATGYDLRFFKKFLSNPVYRHHKNVIKFNDSKNWREIKIKEFTLTLVYAGLDSWQDRIDIMLKWREIADKYKESLDVSVWETNAMFVDQMLGLKNVSIQSGLFTIFCMLIVCVIFIRDVLGVIAAVSSIGSIVTGVIGYLYFWDLDLDPASLGAILMSVGMSVDFTAHTIYAYMKKETYTCENGRQVTVPLVTELDRMKNCISSIMYPMLQGGISTVVCVMPLLCIPDYIPLVFFKTIVLVVVFGLYHGCVVLPGFMVLFTPIGDRLNEKLMGIYRDKPAIESELQPMEPQPPKEDVV